MDFHLFSSETYKRRRDQLMTGFEEGLIWILGNGEAPKNYTDNTYQFRQDSNFLYYAGIDLPDFSLLIDLQSSRTYLCGDDRSVELVVWMGPQPTVAALAEKVGIHHTLSNDQLKERISQAVKKSEKVHYLPPYRGFSRIKLAEWLNKALPEVEKDASVELIKTVVKQRSIKEKQELDQMEIALSITRDMHLEVMYETKAAKKESDLVAQLMQVVHRTDVDIAYPIILTINGQTLHNHYHGNTLQDGQLLLGDFGAECPMHYAGDITRTIPVSGKFTSAQRDIYSIVLAGQQKAIDLMRPGMTYKEIHLATAKVMTQGLVDLGFMKGNIDEIVAAGAHALFFPHGLGHMIGLDVHDMEDLGEDYVGYNDEIKRSNQFGLRSLRFGKELSAGIVLTVEPGLYFIPELIEMWSAEKKFNSFISYEKLDPFK
ncbi:MAG: aminopeptidase P N-terminal domain-containing protein, partial [Saprospiraceae bacterium]|nr:aminopeptidase P N-terminal domain-containing protein [Saprospiraceae bacterium]